MASTGPATCSWCVPEHLESRHHDPSGHLQQQSAGCIWPAPSGSKHPRAEYGVVSSRPSTPPRLEPHLLLLLLLLSVSLLFALNIMMTLALNKSLMMTLALAIPSSNAMYAPATIFIRIWPLRRCCDSRGKS